MLYWCCCPQRRCLGAVGWGEAVVAGVVVVAGAVGGVASVVAAVGRISMDSLGSKACYINLL